MYQWYINNSRILMEFKIEKKREKKKAGLKMEKIEREKYKTDLLYIYIYVIWLHAVVVVVVDDVISCFCWNQMQTTKISSNYYYNNAYFINEQSPELSLF